MIFFFLMEKNFVTIVENSIDKVEVVIFFFLIEENLYNDCDCRKFDRSIKFKEKFMIRWNN